MEYRLINTILILFLITLISFIGLIMKSKLKKILKKIDNDNNISTSLKEPI